MPRDLRTALVENEPPSITEHGSDTDIDTDHHITEEKPRSDKSFSTVTRRSPHDHVVGRVKAESRRGQTTVQELGQISSASTAPIASYTDSVTRLTQSSCTGIKASGIPRRTVKKIETTSPILDEMRYRMNCLVLL